MNLSIFLFIFIFSSLYLGIHFYVYYQIVTGLSLKGPAQLIFKLIIGSGALSFIASEFISRRITPDWIKPFYYFGNIWLGIISISVCVLLVRNLVLLFVKDQQAANFSAMLSLLAIFLLSAFSAYNSERSVRIKEITIRSAKLPEGTDKFVLAQISDIHMDLIKSPKTLEEIVQKTNALKPDAVLITGDLIDADLLKIDRFCAALKEIRTRYGTYAVTGNHEFYVGTEVYRKILESSGITFLQNENKALPGGIELIGIDDSESKRFENVSIKENLSKAVKYPNPADFRKFTVLLSHRPFIFDEAAKLGIDLQLSGHTHAGQIPPMDLIVMLFLKYPYGYYSSGNSRLYTTAGTGYWGPPMRLFSRAEIVIITLEKEKGPGKS